MLNQFLICTGYSKLTLRATPATLTNQKATAQDLGVHLAALGINDRLLSLKDGARLSLVVDADNLIAQLELPSGTRRGQWLQDCDLALSINSTAMIQVGNARDLDSLLARIEIGHLLVGELESWSIRIKLEMNRMRALKMSYIRRIKG
jgi:hypothetical protein